MKESMSITRRSQPAPAPADQARPDQLRQHPIKLARMPEAERAQEGVEGAVTRRAVSALVPGPQDVAIVNRIRPKRHGVRWTAMKPTNTYGKEVDRTMPASLLRPRDGLRVSPQRRQ